MSLSQQQQNCSDSCCSLPASNSFHKQERTSKSKLFSPLRTSNKYRHKFKMKHFKLLLYLNLLKCDKTSCTLAGVGLNVRQDLQAVVLTGGVCWQDETAMCHHSMRPAVNIFMPDTLDPAGPGRTQQDCCHRGNDYRSHSFNLAVLWQINQNKCSFVLV